MIAFFTGCADLFSMIFDATWELDFFKFLYGLLIVWMLFSFYTMLHRGLRKL
jgi:hypothetical protein